MLEEMIPSGINSTDLSSDWESWSSPGGPDTEGDSVRTGITTLKKAGKMTSLRMQGWLAVYACCVTTTLLGVLILLWHQRKAVTSFDEITVHRINIVEPDGAIRMVLTDKAEAPGFYVKNKEYPHPNRQLAGMLFYDDEGTENGGLAYGLSGDSSGKPTSNFVHLSFDQYMQDQIFTVDAGRDGSEKYSELTMQDRGDYSILDAIEAEQRISKLPSDQQEPAWKEFKTTHPGDEKRVILGRAPDGSSLLSLKDPAGRDRIVLRVSPDGTPKVQVLDASGRVLEEMPKAR